MQELSLVEGAQRREFVDVVWQIAEKRGCDEVICRYDCGHAIRAEVWAPALPKTREYGIQDAERQRFMQHSIFVLTKDPAAPKVQITVPEGRCRHCGRGTRQVLICGPIQMDLTDDRARGRLGAVEQSLGKFGPARRLELPLSSHAFLAAMGQVCKLPENVTPPPLLQGSSSQNGALKLFDGPLLPREGLRQWSRKEVEDELTRKVVKYVGGATFVLLFIIAEIVYLCVTHFGPSNSQGDSEERNGTVVPTAVGELSNLSSVSALEMGIANSTWALSALTLSVHKAFGPSPDGGDKSGGPSMLWSVLIHPLWVVVSVVLAPVLWVLDLIVAVPRYVIIQVGRIVMRGVIWKPFGWACHLLGEIANNSVLLLFRCIFSRPTAVLSQIPMMNPMAVAMVLSLLVAALSAPQPPSLSLPSLWGDLPNLDILRRVQNFVLIQKLQKLFSTRKDGRNKGGVRTPTARAQKGKAQADGNGKTDTAGGKPDRSQAGQKDGRTPSNQTVEKSIAPACFVCLEEPSRYILEPCGHRVVCGDCAVKLVAAAANHRSNTEALGGAHHADRGRDSGACPSCGMAITRAMRLFS